MIKMIKTNKIKCNHCGDVIESRRVHEYKECKCGRVAVDGGHEYLRRCFQVPEDYTELSEVIEDDQIDSPDYYHSGIMDAIDVIEAYDLNFNLGNVIKYVLRAGYKPGEEKFTALKKASWYLEREIIDCEPAEELNR